MRKGAVLAVFVMLGSLPLAAEDIRLGKPIDVESLTPIRDLLDRPEAFVGKTVKVEGTVTEVCAMMQCWMQLEDPSGKAIRVKVEDGEILFPKESVGRRATAQGTLTRVKMTREQYIASLEHEAEERGETVDTSGIREGKTIYRLQGQGAVIH